MIVLLKICAAGEKFGKVCLKAILDTLFLICVLQSGDLEGVFGWRNKRAEGHEEGGSLLCSPRWETLNMKTYYE